MNALKIFEIIEDNFGISEVAIPNVSFSQVQEAMATLSTFLLQQQINVGELMTELLSLEQSITLSRIQESHQTTIDSYFGHQVSVSLFSIDICDDI